MAIDWTKAFLGGLSAEAPQTTYAHQGQIQDLIGQGLQNRTGTAAPQLASGPQNQFRSGQMAQVQQLQGIASGQQQGAGELAAQRQVQNALAAQQGMARMARGGNAGMANLSAARGAGAVGLAGAGLGQQAAMQDQQGAQAMLAQALGQGRGQDISLAGQNAQLTQQQGAQNNQMYIQLLSQLTGMDANQLAAKLGLYQTDKQSPGLLGSLLSAGGQIAAAAV